MHTLSICLSHDYPTPCKTYQSAYASEDQTWYLLSACMVKSLQTIYWEVASSDTAAYSDLYDTRRQPKRLDIAGCLLPVLQRDSQIPIPFPLQQLWLRPQLVGGSKPS